jgi:hypothetical protein
MDTDINTTDTDAKIFHNTTSVENNRGETAAEQDTIEDEQDEAYPDDSHNPSGIELIMNPSQYSTIVDEEANETTGVMNTGVVQRPSTSYRTPLIVGAALLFVVVGVSTMSSRSAVPEPGMTAFSANVPLEGEGHTRACLFDECYATKCNGAVAPYTCLFHNGGPHGGWYVTSYEFNG